MSKETNTTIHIHRANVIRFCKVSNGGLRISLHASIDDQYPRWEIVVWPDGGQLPAPNDIVREHDSLGEAIDIVAGAARMMGGSES